MRDANTFVGSRSMALAAAMAMFGGGVGLFSACTVEPEGDAQLVPRDGLPLQQPIAGTKVPAPLPGAHCEIQVEGVGLIDLEEDYLPHVITCENGGAGLEALKAQAIAARSVAYYAIETSGSICDSQGCQVYSCAAEPGAIAYQAVNETSGQYLMYNNTLTYGFYVAGDNNTSPPSCVGVSGATEGWVTYNEGSTGFDVEQTALGFIHDPGDPGYGQNRGCMSQWGARCLENDNGYDTHDILRFYYGDDIELVQAQGACVMPLPGDDSGPSDGSSSGTTGDTTGDPSTSGPADDSTSGLPPDSGGDDDPLPGGTAEDTMVDPPGGDDGGSTGGGVDPALPGTFGEDDDEGSCACRTGPTRGSAWWLMLVLGVVGRRRR